MKGNRIIVIAILLSSISILASEKLKTDLTNELVDAASTGDLTTVKMLIEGININGKASGNVGRTPLIAAAEAGQLNALDYLLSKKASVNEKNKLGATALMMVIGEPRLSENVIKIIVQKLLAAGASPTIADNRGNTPLSIAQGRRLSSIVALLSPTQPTDVQKLNKQLIDAILSDNLSQVKQSIEQQHADVNAVFKYSLFPASITPLIVAAGSAQVEIIKYLLSKGADINAIDSLGRTAFMKLFIGNEMRGLSPEFDEIKAATELFLENPKLNVNQRDQKGKTAFGYLRENYPYAPKSFLDFVRSKGAQ